MSSGPQVLDDKVGPESGGRGIGGTLATAVAGFVRAHVMLLSIIVLLVLVYALAGFLLVPRIARSQAESYVTTELGKKLSLGEIRFNPFALDASIAGMRLTEPDGSVLVSFRHLYVNASIASLWHRGVVLESVELSAPDIQVVVERDGSVNLASLIPPEDAEEQDEPPPRVRIGHLSVVDGRLGLEERTRARPFFAAVQPIRFVLNDFRTDIDFRNAYHFAGVTSRGEQLDWSGGFTVQPFGSSGEFRVGALRMATIDSYLEESLPFHLAEGHAQLHGDYRFTLEPFALDVTMPSIAVRDLAVTERGLREVEPIRVPEIDVQQVQFSLAKRTLGVQSVDVRGATMEIIRDENGSLSLEKLFGSTPPPDATAAPADATAAAEPASEPKWNLKVDAIRVEQASIRVEDRSVQPAAQFAIAPAKLTLEGWSNDPAAALRIDADVGVNGNGRVATRGEVKLEPISGDLTLEASELDLTAVQPYLSQLTSLRLHSGTLSSKGALTFSTEPAEQPPFKFDGEVQVANLRTTDPADQDFVKWRSLAVSGIHYEQHPERLTIERVLARQPYARVVIAQDTTLNLTQVMQPATAQTGGTAASQESGSAPPATPASKPMTTRIRTVEIVDGSANFADYSIQPSFATGILELNGRVQGLSSVPESRAQVTLQGKVDKYAPVDITGEVNLLAAAVYTDLAMNFRNMELTTFNPYSGKFAGYAIARGKLSTELKYHVENRKLDAQHHIVVDNLEFGEKTDSKDAAPIPIKLAVALLKDRNGVIDVELPVTGTLDDPKFRLGPIIWKAILGLLTKIVTAPFAALGALFGGGDELAYVDFAPGSAQLAAPEAEKLTNLARALVERPQLKLNVPITAVGNEDGDALAHAALAAKLPAGLPTEATDEASAQQRLKALEALYRTQMKAPPDYPPPPEGAKPDPVAQAAWIEEALLAQLRPDDAALDELARQRARAVQDALLANTDLSPERVFITNERTGTKQESGAVRMEMKLE